MLKFSLIAITSLVVAATAVAHPGHGQAGDGFSLVHYLTEPSHVFGGVAILLSVVFATALLRILMAEPLKGSRAHVEQLLDNSPTASELVKNLRA